MYPKMLTTFSVQIAGETILKSLDETLSIHLEDECKTTGKLGNLDHHLREVAQSGESSQ